MRRPDHMPSGLGTVLALGALLLLLCLGLAFLLLPPDLIRSPELAFKPPGPAPSRSPSSEPPPTTAEPGPVLPVDSNLSTRSTADPSSTTLLADGSSPRRAAPPAGPSSTPAGPPPPIVLDARPGPETVPSPPDPPETAEAHPPDRPSVSFLGGPLDRIEPDPEPAPTSPDPDLSNRLPVPAETDPGGSSSKSGGSGESSESTAGAPRRGGPDDEAGGDSLVPDEPDGPRRVAPLIRSAAAKAAERDRPVVGLDPYVDPVDWRNIPLWRQTRFFNIRAEGAYFAFVVDCSGSMDDDFRLVRAKRELRRCLNAMRYPQRYTVVFFNDRSIPLAGGVPRPADPENNQSTFDWLNRIEADGGTDPREAMTLALGLQPDAVFLLTDGEFPADTEAVMIDQNPKRVPIHCINLGSSSGAAQLRSIAESSGGRYASPR